MSLKKQKDLITPGIICLALILLLLSSFAVPAQKIKDDQEFLKWQRRVETLTEGVIADASSLDVTERAIYLALLGKVWWTTDPLQAKNYVNSAVDLTVKSIDSFDDTNLNAKIKHFQKTAEIVAALDDKLGQAFVEKVAKILDAKGNNEKANADTLVGFALQVVDKNPRLAFDLSVRSLKFGNSTELVRVLLKLMTKETALAESLFDLTIAAARRKYNYEFVGIHEIVFKTRDGKTFSDRARRAYLGLLADLLSEAAANELDRTRCEMVTLVTPNLARFDEYLPDQALVVRQQTQVCLTFAHPFTAGVARAEAASDAPQTVNDLIRAARETRDTGLKVRYFHKAMLMLEKEKKYIEIISLLDGLDGDDLKAMTFAWDDWRSEYAYLAALAAFENTDMPSVYRIINKTPKKNRPYVRFRLVYKLSPTKDRDFMLENLEEIRKEVSTLEIESRFAASNFLSLARLYLKIQPTESEAMFREAVKYINKTDGENPEFEPIKDWAPLMDYVQIPWEILDADEPSITSSLTNISARRSRVRLKLGLLESSLKKYAIEKKRLEEKTRPKKSKQTNDNCSTN